MLRILGFSLLLISLGPISLRGSDAPKAVLPSDLVPPCRVVHIVRYVTWDGSGNFEVLDRMGKRLIFGYASQTVFFGAGKNTVKSAPGSQEEQVLLKILKQALADTYYSTEDRDGDQRRGFDHFIRVLEHRCRTKADPPYGH